MKKVSGLVILGVLNVIHGLSHLVQLGQSLCLAFYSLGNHKEDNWYHNMMDSPWMGLIWVIVGCLTIYLGIRDFRHHIKHKD